MSVMLADASDRRCKVDGWSWGVFAAALEAAAIVDDATWHQLRHGRAELDGAQVQALAAIARALLGDVPPGYRLYYDGTVTDERDEATERDRPWRNYALGHDALAALTAFLDGAVAPVIVC